MIYVAVLLTVLQLFDGWTTYQIIVRFGGREKNELMVWLMEKVGSVYGALLIAKCVAIALCWVLALAPVVDGLTSWIRFALMMFLSAFYIWVAQNNWNVYRRLRG